MDSILDNLINAINTWNEKVTEMWLLLSQSPEEFKNGTIWNVMVQINNALVAIGLALVVLFFVVGVLKTTANLNEIKRPEQALKLFLRFIIAKSLVLYGMELMQAVFSIVQGITITIMDTVSAGEVMSTSIPDELIAAVEEVGFLDSIPLWAITFIGSLFIIILSFIMILTVYGRFFKLYLYTAISPIPLSASAGEMTQSTTISFVKSYIGVCLEGSIIVLACIIFTTFATTSPVINVNTSAVSMVWSYIGELIFNMLILVGTVKASDRVVKEMMGL